MKFLFFALGLALLLYGARLLVISVSGLSLRLGLKPLFLSILLLGVGTSAPEWFVTVTSSLKGFSDIALGNVIGSNIANVWLVLGCTGLFYRYQSEPGLLKRDLPACLLLTLILGLFLQDAYLSRLEAAALLGFFLVYLLILFRAKSLPKPELRDSQEKFGLLACKLLLGFAFLFTGSMLTVDSASEIGRSFNIPEKFLGLFLVSLGTSLPELAVSFQAVVKKESQMALGNILGSNLFNIMFVLGSAGLIQPLSSRGDFFALDYWVMLASICMLALVLFFLKSLPRVCSAGFFALYLCYLYLSL